MSRSKVFIIHGTFGNPSENWFPWLRTKLEEMDCAVTVPEFPTPENQSLDNWLAVFSRFEAQLDNNTVLVGHSLGPAFILAILEGNRKVKAAFLVAAFTGLLNIPEFDRVNRSFVVRDFVWRRIRENCGKFVIYESDNDPYVPADRGQELAQKLGAELKIVPKAGHFNTRAGYTTFELLLNDIASTIGN